MERAAPTKHELWNGELFAMAGATFVHNQLVGNLARVLGNLVLDGPCVVLPSDMKIHVPASEGYVYPDLSVVCRPPETAPPIETDRVDAHSRPQQRGPASPLAPVHSPLHLLLAGTG